MQEHKVLMAKVVLPFFRFDLDLMRHARSISTLSKHYKNITDVISSLSAVNLSFPSIKSEWIRYLVIVMVVIRGSDSCCGIFFQ